jgi:outer membrane lipoprotein-sorting protein
VSIAIGGTAIAIAATGNGPVPPSKPLANAAHDALAGPAPQGLTARITFTNHLISSSGAEGIHADPLLMGASGRLWLSKGHFRIELQSGRGDAQVVADDKRFWVYDPGAHTVYRGDLPKELAADNATNDTRDVPSLDQVKKFISRLMEHASVSGATPGNVGGQRAYTVRVSPKENGGLVGGADLAWDALNGVPLRIAVFAKGGSSPVLELTASNVSYGPVDTANFDVSPPPDAKVVEVSTPSGDRNGTPDAKDPSGRSTPVEGVDAVAKAVQFKLSAPATLAGMTRNQVRLLHSSKDGAALVTYGQGLGGIAVLEQGRDSSKPADQSAPPQDSGGDHGGLSLPTVSINGVNAQELATPLGTVVRFERGGVAYTVIGSVLPAAAEAAARGL